VVSLDFYREIFIPVVLSGISRPRSGSEIESKDPENVSAALPQQGILPMICLALLYRFPQTA
jgi:hypothetical protein